MDELGAFTPEQARLLWQDYLSRRQLPDQINRAYPQRQQIYDVSPHRVFVHNTEAEVIPSFGCMRITGVEVVGGKTCLSVEKPTSVDGEFVFNGPYPIPPDNEETPGCGWGYRHGIVLMLGDEPTDVGELYQPIVNSWEIETGGGSFTVFGRDITSDRALIGRIGSGGGSGGGDIMHFNIIEVDSEGWLVEPTFYSGGCTDPPGADPYTGEYHVQPLGCNDPSTPEEMAGKPGVAIYTYNLETCTKLWKEINHCVAPGC